ncbi:MAG: two pore domain potassium channel family protein [candidate division Zixibacteria bacterium]|nr:two pore domain potassium channel family protein [candidate division Zixibacteria bacterium]
MKGRLLYLTVSMILLLGLYPFLETTSLGNIILNVLISVVCLTAVYVVSNNKINLAIALILGVPWFMITWLNLVREKHFSVFGYAAIILLVLFYLFTAIAILRFILKSTKITKDLLFGVVSVYLLTGGTFSMIYLLIETISPGSFFINPEMNINGILDGSDFIYFSFVTLTTLGYGDIIPVSSVARSFSMIEAIIGVMYLAIIISRTVGMFLSQTKTNENSISEE